jgi:diamine N-acetyltransferase
LTQAGYTLRDARPGDEATVARLVRELAAYEKLEHEALATDGDFRGLMFGEAPLLFGLIAEADGDAIGIGLYYRNVSTFTGRAGIYVEDVYVVPDWRGRGIGGAIFRTIAGRALAMGCVRMEWSVLDWNQPAIDFYRAIGAKGMDEWTVQRLDGAALTALATGKE